MKERNVFNSLAVRFSECEKLIYDNMKKVIYIWQHTKSCGSDLSLDISVAR